VLWPRRNDRWQRDAKLARVKRSRETEKKISVEIDKGSPNGEQFTVSGEGDCVPGVDPGDVIAVIKVRPNKMFSRKGADLYMDKEITLLESLTS